MKKKTSHAFGKKIFFLGRDKDNINHWLEQAKWDCDWYWGFGYIETYTNNANPDRSNDINCHTHFDSIVFNKNSHTINDILKTPFDDKEAWELSDLLKSFYTLKDTSGW